VVDPFLVSIGGIIRSPPHRIHRQSFPLGIDIDAVPLAFAAFRKLQCRECLHSTPDFALKFFHVYLNSADGISDFKRKYLRSR
jgi:hypothetical protein